jgi:hypothetical protein
MFTYEVFIGVKTILKCDNIDLIGQISMFTEHYLQDVGSFVYESLFLNVSLATNLFFNIQLYVKIYPEMTS